MSIELPVSFSLACCWLLLTIADPHFRLLCEVRVARCLHFGNTLTPSSGLHLFQGFEPKVSGPWSVSGYACLASPPLACGGLLGAPCAPHSFACFGSELPRTPGTHEVASCERHSEKVHGEHRAEDLHDLSLSIVKFGSDTRFPTAATVALTRMLRRHNPSTIIESIIFLDCTVRPISTAS